jgi:cytochrome c biogenesis protein CcdA
MLRLIGTVLSIGLADSMNPSTIVPGLYMASGDHAHRELLQFTVAVFAVYFLGGAVLVFGPGQALLALVPRPDAETRYILELIAGVSVLAGGAIVWKRRSRLAAKELPAPSGKGRSSFLLGASITVVELPTAFPYFAAIAAIVGSGVSPPERLIALGIYNASFVLPLLGILATLSVAGDHANEVLTRAREFVQRRWPVLVAGLALVAGVFVTVLGATGLAGQGHGTVAHLSRHLRHILTKG